MWSNFNDWLAAKITNSVSTMVCAYLFAALALVAAPQAYHDTFTDGFHALPLITWLSQSFLQLVLLSIIMVGQKVEGKSAEVRANEQYSAVMETLKDVREDHKNGFQVLDELKKVMMEEDEEESDLEEIKAKLTDIEKLLSK